MSENRFEMIHIESHQMPKNATSSGRFIDYIILKDKVTGVLYLKDITHHSNPALTPLLGPDGKPLVDKD